MKVHGWLLATALFVIAPICGSQDASDTDVVRGPCHGRFPNPISDVCWSCVFPISIGPASITNGQEDSGDQPPLICTCPAPPPLFVRIGVGIGYWEPARISEVVRTPWCSPTLDGQVLADYPAPAGTHAGHGDDERYAFYHVHWFTYPLLSWIGAAITSTACEIEDSFDLAYVTELDPLWDDDELAFLINPEGVLFANVPAQAACIADTIAAARGFGIDSMFWCSGSQGSVYPTGGSSAYHVGAVDTSHLLTHRMAFKLHRQFLAEDTSTTGAMCEAQYQPIMRKGQYKLSMLYPVPSNRKALPFGRPTPPWVAGREYPYEGEDFGHLVFRKRLCCAF